MAPLISNFISECSQSRVHSTKIIDFVGEERDLICGHAIVGDTGSFVTQALPLILSNNEAFGMLGFWRN
jgi:hypothetical protein